MLKKFILLLSLSPSYFVFAEEVDLSQTDENNIDVVSKKPKKEPRSINYFFSQCYQNTPPIVVDKNPLPSNQVPINIEAEKIHGVNNTLTYQDNVYLTQGIKTLTADKVTYYKEENKALAEGNISYNTGEVTLFSDNVEALLNNDQTRLQQVNYQFHGQGGRGSAEQMYDNGQSLYEINSSIYSACPPGDNTWSLSSSTLYIDNEEGVGSAYNAVIRVKDIPVFYLPYITYPISDKRKTGLLFPTYSFPDTNGFTFTQPLYINIAENIDATLTPVYMQNRGTLLKNELRYLYDIGSGTFAYEYLGDDKIEDDKRTLFYWKHGVSFASKWKLTSEYTSVSDDDYFTDLDTDYGTLTDSQLLQTAKLTYTETNWDAELEVRDFQILDADSEDDTSHRVLPKLAFNAYKPLNWKSLQLDFYSEVTNFDHSSDNLYEGTRIHLQPKLSLPLYYNSFFVNSELKYMASFYQQTIPETDDYEYDELDESASRFIPSFKINSGINFERDFNFANEEYKQTLVPQFQYLYVPYRDQSDIGIYDSTEMELDYYALFRDNRFSGYDRIADANVITFGFSSSILNSEGQEKVHFAIGQNYYFKTSKTVLSDYDDDDDDYDTVSGSEIVGNFDINLNQEYFFHSGMEYDTDENKINSANTAIEKRWKYNTFAQINYRYVAIDDDDDEDDLVNQLGGKFKWSMNTQWASYGSYYYDLENMHSYETIVGVKYQSCCWSLGLAYKDYLYSVDTEEYESSYLINFELKGLGGAASGDGVDTSFDYGRPFYLQ